MSISEVEDDIWRILKECNCDPVRMNKALNSYREAIREAAIDDALLVLDGLMGELSETGPLVHLTLKLAYDRIDAMREL